MVPSIKAARTAGILRTNTQIAKAKAHLEAMKKTGTRDQSNFAMQKVSKAYKDAGVNIFGASLMPMAQLPVAIGLFLGVQRMCSLPVEQLKHSGMSFMPDLTLVPGTEAFDPFYIVPVLGVLALNYQLKVGEGQSYCHVLH